MKVSEGDRRADHPSITWTYTAEVRGLKDSSAPLFLTMTTGRVHPVASTEAVRMNASLTEKQVGTPLALMRTIKDPIHDFGESVTQFFCHSVRRYF